MIGQVPSSRTIVFYANRVSKRDVPPGARMVIGHYRAHDPKRPHRSFETRRFGVAVENGFNTTVHAIRSRAIFAAALLA